MYKIKISCTNEEDLNYNQKKCKKKIILDTKFNLLMKNNKYIEKGLFLYKTKDNFTTKTLEVLCNSEISEKDFKTFIQDMKNIGFSSKKDNHRISFINVDKPHNPIYSCYFGSLENCDIKNYKIKISCTNEEDLNYKKEKCTKKIILDDEFKLLMENNKYIEKGLFLHKTQEKFTTKTLEFLCNNEISEEDFKTFIQDMKNIGFSSKNDNHRISFINVDNPHNPIYSCYFVSLENCKKKKKNGSCYATELLYKNN